jgi:SAM-dependent methyltransferase
VVADLAAGTGKLTRRLLESGARVIAVEPLAEMRTVLAQQAPAAEILAGSAEAIPLPDSSLDALTVAQAFHWFEAERALAEIARVLRPGGSLALVWNVRDLADEFQQQIDLLLAPHRGSTPSQHDRRWRDALARSPSFGREQLSSFDWSQAYTAAELVERVGSVSFVAALAPPEREALLEEVRMLGAVTPEPFPFRYRTELHFYPRLGEAPGGR